jgi:hypothetical protein
LGRVAWRRVTAVDACGADICASMKGMGARQAALAGGGRGELPPFDVWIDGCDACGADICAKMKGDFSGMC